MLPERILRRIVVLEDGCWDWLGSKLPHGYGQTYYEGRLWRLHRLTYTLYVGPIPEGLVLDHLCRHPPCSNPAHLEAVTNAENSRRGIASEVNGALNRAKTHCPKGHPYAGDNLHVRKRGSRECRTCMRERTRARKAAAR